MARHSGLPRLLDFSVAFNSTGHSILLQWLEHTTDI